MKKRTAALIFLAFVVALVVASLAVLRTEWAGGRVCSAAAAKVEAVTGLHLGFQSCRLDLFGLAVVAEGVALGPLEAPIFSADAVSARLAAVQALGSQIHLERLSLTRPRLTATVPRGTGGPATCPPAFLSRFDVRNLSVEDGTLALTLPEGRLAVEKIAIRSNPAPRTLRTLARASRRTQVSVETGAAALTLGGRTYAAARLAARGELAPDLSVAEVAQAEAEVGGARLGLSGTVKQLCAPDLDLTATADGPVAALFALAGVPVPARASGTAALTAHVKGRTSSAGAARPGEAPGATKAPEKGAAPAPELGGAPAARPGSLELTATLRTRGVELNGFRPGDAEAELRLVKDALVIDALRVPFAGGKLAAHGTIRLAPGLPVTAEADLSGVDLAEVLDRLTITDPWITLRLDGKARVQGPLWPPRLAGRVELGLRDFKVFTRSYRQAAGDPGLLALDRARVDGDVRVDREGLYFDHARLAAGRGVAEADAAIRFSRAGGFMVQVRGEADLDVLRRIGVVPWAGLASVEATVAAAPYGLPRVTGHARATGFRFLDVSLGAIAGDVRFEDRLLHLENVEGTQAAARYHGEAVVDLFAQPVRVVSARYQAHGPVRVLCEAVMDRLPRALYLRDALEGEVEVTGTARGPAVALDADFDAQLSAGALQGRRIDGGSAAGHIRAAEEVRFERLEVRRAGGTARASGTWGFEPPFPWALEVTFGDWPLAALDLPPGSLAGSASGTATLAGSYLAPRVHVAAEVSGFSLEGVRLGAGGVEARLEDGVVKGTAHAEGLELSAEVGLSGKLPFRARGKASLDDAARLFPGAPAGLKARLAGQGTAEGDLSEWREARVEGTLAQLAASYADLRIATTAPARLSAARGRWELAPVTLEGPNTQLTVAGAVLPGGGLDGSASGGFDLRLLSGAVPSLRRAGGRLGVEAHLGGTVDAPLLVGSGKVTDGALQLKGTTASLTAMNGVLAFSQSKVIFDRLDATVNGGHATFKGEVELDRLVPARLRAEGVLDEVPVAVPAYLPATLSGRIEAEGTPEATTVTGRLHVTRARYTADVDLEGKVLQRRPPPPPRAYDRAGEWLRFDLQLAVDGDVRVENDLVRGPVSGELVLAGSLAAPGLVGSLAMGRGSKATFRGNEFDLSHAVLDFTDRSRIQGELDVHGESQVRDYQVFLVVNGTLEQPRVKLTSLPDLPEQDIVTLLSLGFTRRDAGAQGGVSGVATATAAQALLSASGLDAQVKRFLPRGGPVRDLSMRVTTAYSEETGQVEPRAEFESWVMKDKLRLRFQTPLGAGRGRQAQAELRLGDHSSLQYQWDNENPDVATGDHGVDLKLRWEWSEDKR